MRRWVVTLLMSGLLAATAAPAWADEVGLSHDGERWGDTLVEPLFDADTIWVPGDSRTVSFYVRHDADTDAVLTATVRSDDSDDLLADAHIALRARAGDAWFRLSNGEPSPELTEASIRAGAPVKVEVQAAFDPRSSNASQADSLSLEFEITMTEALTDRPGDRPDDPPPGWLPPTGADVSATWLWAAGLLVVMGTALMIAGRREKERDNV